MSLRPPWAALAMTAALCLTGCAHERIGDETRALLRLGDYEGAIAHVEAGLRKNPDSAKLRSVLIQVRSEATSRLLAEVATARALGRLDEAQTLLERAGPYDSGSRVAALMADLEVERRQRKALEEARTLVTAQRPQQALRVLAEALKDNPRQQQLLQLQREVAADVRQRQVRAMQAGLAESRPISLDFRDAGLRTVLDVVTRTSGVNFVLDKDVRSDVRITVFLRSARVEDAIDLIVGTHGLAKKLIDSQTILIYPNTPDKQREHQELVVRVFHLASADAKGAASFLRSMLSIREPFIDERSNMLSLRDSPENIELAERLIRLYDTQEPEVLLDLEVIEVRMSRLTDLGIRFPDSMALTVIPPAGGLTLGNIGDQTRNGVAVGVGGALLNFKREVGDFTTLANPRIRAKNKEKAKVLVGDKVPVVTTRPVSVVLSPTA